MNKNKQILLCLLASTLFITSCGTDKETNLDQPNRTAYKVDNYNTRVVNDGDNLLKKLKREHLELLKENHFDDLKETDEINKQTFKNASDRLKETPTDKSMQMARDYWEAIDNAEKETGTPKWVLLGIASLEGNGLYTKNPPVPGTSIPTHLYGVNGMNFKTYGKEQIEEGYGDRASGKTDNSKVGGPFKFMDTTWEGWASDGNNDGKKDRFNLYDSALGAAKMLKFNYDYVHSLYPEADEDAKWIWTMNAHNAGRGGMLASIPLDSLEEFIEIDLKGIVSDKATQSLVYSRFINLGRGWALREPIISYWDNKGWKFDPTLRKQIEDKTTISLNMGEGTPNPNKRWPGNIKGIRTDKGYKTERSYKAVAHRNDRKGDRISMNMERLEYSVASYSIGKNMEMELRYRIETDKEYITTKPKNLTGTNSVQYYWETLPNKNSLSQKDKMLYEGKYGEVGWKGDFPIFIQEIGLNSHSKIPWKFENRNTTLGKSGCSIYAIASMLHSAGLGETYIPNTNKLPTLENLSKVFNNGPITYTDLINQGYQVQILPTGSIKDLETLFRNLKSGIPYIVNTRRGTVYGVTRDGEKITTKFTNGGHFLILTSAYEDRGKRFVEVVQSSRSYGSTKGVKEDQNRIAFDFDKLVDNSIIRSSGGFPVPAYTIIGTEEGKESNYLSPNYKTPREVSKTDVITSTVTEINRESVKKDKYESKTMEYLKSISDEQGYLRVGEVIRAQEPLLVEYKNNNLYLYLDYINGVKITQLKNTPIFEGAVPKGTKLGTITGDTELEFIIRDHNNKRWLNIVEVYDVSE